MLAQIWKNVLNNWLNCFFDDQELQENVNVKSLLKVVSLLHKSFCFDDSKSSLLEATTLEEFIKEKYPEFTFENGSVTVTTEDEIYCAASLLLFFLCVNSKDIDMKKAMCKNLNDEQQEIILNFNKCLMECSSITYNDLQVAIKEACQTDKTMMGPPTSVAETPPALRSLHNEVQRLRAALDAERFDKNYFQDEIARSNSLLAKMTKERDKYKEEVLMLSSRIDSDFDESNKKQVQSSGRKKIITKLKKQLEDMEQRLVDTQTQLEDVQNECEIYKSKVEELKLERDKWVVFGEKESSKAQQLIDQLEKEKTERESLLQLISELRQHNQQNGVDTSQLECDDPDVSVRSLGGNSSMCNEMCANVIEVQLCEERARITELTQKLHALQDQVTLLENTSASEKSKLELELSEKITDIAQIKDQVNLLIQEKIKCEECHNDEKSRLCKIINDMEQKINDVLENNTRDLENKMKEIRKMQKENEALTLKFASDITNMEDEMKKKDIIINNLKVDINTEISLKLKHERLIEILNEKLLDKDKEFVAVNNILSGRNIEMENTKITLQKHIKMYQDLEDKYSSYKMKFQEQEIKLQQIYCELKKKTDILECLNEKLKESEQKVVQLSEAQNNFLKKIETLDSENQSLEVELNNIQSAFSDEKHELEMALSQKDAALAVLSLDLEQEFNDKNDLLNKNSLLNNQNQEFSLEVQCKTEELQKMATTVDAQMLELENLRLTNNNLQQILESLNVDKQNLTAQLKEKNDRLISMESENKIIVKQFECNKADLCSKLSTIEVQLSEERARGLDVTQNLQNLQIQSNLLQDTAFKDKIKMGKKLFVNTKEIENLKIKIDMLIEQMHKLVELNNDEMNRLNKTLHETEKCLLDSQLEVEKYIKEIQMLQEEKSAIIQSYTTEIEKLECIIKDKGNSLQNSKLNLDIEIDSKIKLEKDYDKVIVNLNQELMNKNNDIYKLQNRLTERNNEIGNNQMKIYQELETKRKEQEYKLQHIRNELKYKSDALSVLEVTLNKNEQKVHQLTEDCAKWSELEPILLKKFSELDTQRSSLQIEVENLRHSFCNKEHELERALAATSLNFEHAVNVKNDVLIQNAQLKNTNKYLKSEIEHKTIELNSMTDRINDQVKLLSSNNLLIEDLKQTVESLLKYKHDLKAMLKDKCDEFESLQSNHKDVFKQFEVAKAEKYNENSLLHKQILELKQLYANILMEKDKLSEKLSIEKVNKELFQKNAQKEIMNLNYKISELNEESESRLLELQHLQNKYSLLNSQISALKETATEEKTMLEKKLFDKNTEIENLRYQIDMLIEEKVKLVENNNDEMSKLNNQLNDKERKMNEVLQNCTRDLENKMTEIEALREEKANLIQNFSTEITKLETTIKNKDIMIHNIKVDLDTEINSKLKLKENYDNCIVNLNQKLANRNNEVVELQNNLLQRSDEIESVGISLQKQIKMYQDLESEYLMCKSQFIEQQTNLHKLCRELENKSIIIKSLEEKLQTNEENVCYLNEQCANSSAIQTKLMSQISDLTIQKDALEIELKNIQTTFSNKCYELQTALSQKDADFAAISLKLEQETKNKEELVKEISQLKENNHDLDAEVKEKTSELQKMIYETNAQFKEFDKISFTNNNLEQAITSLNKDKQKLMAELKQLENCKSELEKDNMSLKRQVEETHQSYADVLAQKDLHLKRLAEELAVEKNEKVVIKKNMEIENRNLDSELSKVKEESKLELQEVEDRLSREHDSLKCDMKLIEEAAIKEKTALEEKLYDMTIELENVKHQIEMLVDEKFKLIKQNDDGITKLKNKISEFEKSLQKSIHEVEDKVQEIQMLQEEKWTLIRKYTIQITEMENTIKDKEIIVSKFKDDLDAEIKSKLILKEDYEKDIVNLNKKLSSKDIEVLGLKTNLIETTNRLEDTNHSLQKQMKLYEDLEAKYLINKSQFKEQQTKLEEVSCELKRNLEKLNKTLQESEEKNASLTERCTELTKIQERLLKENTEINEQRNSLELQLKDVKSSIDKKECELEIALSQKSAELSAMCTTLKQEINYKEDLIKEVSDLNATNSLLLLTLEEKSNEMKNIANTVRGQAKDIEDMTLVNKNLQYTVDSLSKDKEELRIKLEEKNKDLIVTENSKAEKEKENEKLKQQVKGIKQTHANVLAEKEKLVEKLSVEKNNKSVLQQNMEVKIQQLNVEISKLKGEIENNQKVIKELQNKEHSLRNHLKSLGERATDEKATLETKLVEKTKEIENLKHQINIVIEEKRALTLHKNQEISKFNNQLKEMEINFEHITNDLEDKMKTIQTLKEENATLIESFAAEKINMEGIIRDKDIVIHNMKMDFETETNAKQKMKDYYENQIMDLNQKLSHSNNDIVELQRTLQERSEKVEKHKLTLQKQIEMYQTLSAEYSIDKTQFKKQEDKLQEISCELKDKLEALKNLTKLLQENEETNSQLRKKCSELIEAQLKTLRENSELNTQLNSLALELKNIKSEFNDKKHGLEIAFILKEADLAEKCLKLKEEISAKEELSKEIVQLKHLNHDLCLEVEQKNKDLENMETVLNEQNKNFQNITSINLNLQEAIDSLKKDKEELLEKFKEKCDDLMELQSNNKISIDQLELAKTELDKENVQLKQQIEDLKHSFDNMSSEKDSKIKQLTEELASERNGKAVVPKNVEAGIQKLHDQISKSNEETKYKLQEIKGLQSREHSLLKTVFRELTNLGDASEGSDGEVKKSSNSGSLPADSLEESSETDENYFKKSTDKQSASLKERDKLAQLCRRQESDLINVKKYLTELSVYIATFNSVRDIYTQKLIRIVSLQRTARREMHEAEGRLSEKVVCQLERRYAAIMQDSVESVMNMERWAAKSVEAAVAPDIIKRAFKSQSAPFCAESLQNGSLVMQLDGLNLAFRKLLEEIAHAPSEASVEETRTATLTEVRAEYEDKLNRMKNKMKELYQEQIGIFRERQKQETAALENKLVATEEKLAELSKAYEEHIRGLTTELWNVGEKFLMKKDEVEWLRLSQKSGSSMSLQQMHSSGLTSNGEGRPRASDTHSLRSLPLNRKTEGRGLHVSDEEGEVFDNRWVRELHCTPPADPELRLSELRWRNSLCPPHLKSSYPAETQFAPTLDEDDIKSVSGAASNRQRKEVGITAYKKPGPPTPSKQAGRLSATGSDLRESLRAEAELAPRKTSTPSRLRALFRSQRHDADNSSTPRSKRLSIFKSRK